MVSSNLRNILFTAALQYNDRAAYISALTSSPVWADAETTAIRQNRVAILGNIYDATHCTINDLLEWYSLSPAEFAQYFNIPRRTVQHWCNGDRECPPYLLAMACEILQSNSLT